MLMYIYENYENNCEKNFEILIVRLSESINIMRIIECKDKLLIHLIVDFKYINIFHGLLCVYCKCLLKISRILPTMLRYISQ